MKLSNGYGILILASLCLGSRLPAFGDVFVMSNGRTLIGTAIQTNDDDILILSRYAAFNFSKTSIKEVKGEPLEAAVSSTNRLPNFQKTIGFLSQQPWATRITPIAATVVDKGILKNVPYSSFRCADDYEVNVYGDLDNPAGIEIGLYRNLLADKAAQSNCANFISNLLPQLSDQKIIEALDLNKDLITRNGLTFEITPPTGEDSYNGWWISVYSEKQLDLARASDDDMKLISMTHADATRRAKDDVDYSSWSENELKQARPSAKTTISFMSASGNLITNAEVVRIIDGVSLIWRRSATSGGMVRLADLPEDLRVRFGYDEAKTKAADDLAAANKARWQQEADANAAVQVVANALSTYEGSSSSGDSYSGSSGGSVYVHGYYRSNGTYVHSYTRSAPHGR